MGKVKATRELKLAIAATILDNEENKDGNDTLPHMRGLGYEPEHPVMQTAFHMLREVCAAGNEPIELFAQEIAELVKMEEDGGTHLHRAALRETQVARNQLCPCGSGQKYKKCCLWRDELPASATKKEKSAVGKLWAAVVGILAGAKAEEEEGEKN